jgi:phosphoglycerol transferase MdoB-like AlkP superfamily enzyme
VSILLAQVDGAMARADRMVARATSAKTIDAALGQIAQQLAALVATLDAIEPRRRRGRRHGPFIRRFLCLGTVEPIASGGRSPGGFWRRFAARCRILGRILAIQLVLWTVLRAALAAAFRDAASTPADLAIVALAGSVYDLLAGLAAALPWLVIVAGLQLRWLDRRPIQHGIVAVVAMASTFDAVVQYFFFDEYDARYNHLALDYLAYPHEVLGNIFASYNVPAFAALAVGAGALLTWGSRTAVSRTGDAWPWGDRVRALGATMALGLALGGAWIVLPTHVRPGRVTNEIALNGWVELVRAYRSAHLDYEAYYAMVPPGEAADRVARRGGRATSSAAGVRHFPRAGRPSGQPLDVVIVLEESLGSDFSARFGPPADGQEPVTPELDRWSREGLSLTDVIATGNRTVRGLEGVLCSFPPLPGDAIVKRDRSENVASVARILRDRGYATTFVYGGYGAFDNLETFMTANGFDDFVEESDFPSDRFRTIWGVADEFVLDEMIARQKAANASGRRWFGTVLTVSNHKPFHVPGGRVSWAPGKSGRRGAVLNADWARGHYLSTARREGLLDHTVVLIVGDHGARVYGAEEIPVASYRVPAIFLTPDPAYRGVVIDRLASQIDLAPTLLSLAGVEYDAPFFGDDVLGLPDAGGRAFVNHNRSIGMLTDTALVTLGLHQSVSCYHRSDRHSPRFVKATIASPGMSELARDTEAAFQTAYRSYMDRTFRLPAPAGPARHAPQGFSGEPSAATATSIRRPPFRTTPS